MRGLGARANMWPTQAGSPCGRFDSQSALIRVHCSAMWLTRRPTVVVLLCAAVVHAAMLMAVHTRTGRIDSSTFASLDCREFYSIARNVAAHGTFSQSESEPLVPDTWRTPGYPLFLAGSMLLLGDSPTVLVILQQLLSILNVLLLHRLARYWMGERRAMLVAILFLLEPYHLKYSLWLMSTTWFVTVLLLVWHCWQRALHTRRWYWFLLLGALSGLLVLVRPVGVLVPVVMFIGLAIDILRHSLRTEPQVRLLRQGVLVIVFAVTCLVVVGSWPLRNFKAAGHFALSDQGGVVLAYFKATEVVLWREGRNQDRYLETTLDPTRREEPHSVWERIDTDLRTRLAHLPQEQLTTLCWQNLAQEIKTPADSFLVSRTLGAIGRSYLTESPLGTVSCCLVRCGSMLTFPLCLALEPPNGLEVSRPTEFAKGALYLALGAAVAVRLFRGRFVFVAAFFPLACTIALLLATTPQLDPRFRVPMVPMLLVIALLSRPLERAPAGKADSNDPTSS